MFNAKCDKYSIAKITFLRMHDGVDILNLEIIVMSGL